MNILKYIEFGVVAVETVTSFIALLAPKKSLTGAQIVAAITPMVSAIQSTFGMTLPTALVADIAQAAADAIDKYVINA